MAKKRSRAGAAACVGRGRSGASQIKTQKSIKKTPMQMAIAEMLTSGMTQSMVARHLLISHWTIRDHIRLLKRFNIIKWTGDKYIRVD
jgi:DNA-binding NarL/FixJ family response regulator